MSDIYIGQTQSMQVYEVPTQTLTTISFVVERIMGSGSFGVVYLATLDDGSKIAIKKVLQDRRYKNRELQIMSSLSHPNIISLRYYFYSVTNGIDTYLNLIMDFYPDTVYSVIKTYFRQHIRLPQTYIRLYAYQLIRSLFYLHSNDNICHRDIKPQNLLVNHDNGKLVLIDFGSAKKLEYNSPNVSYICSRYYRAPELIFGATNYTTAIDMWSAGCVIAELILGQPFFPGETGVDQLVEIIRVLGTPTSEDIAEMNRSYTEDDFPMIKAQPWSRIFRVGVPHEAIDLISKLLVYIPNNRLTALQALSHSYFDVLRNDGILLPNGVALPELFNFSEKEIELMREAGLYEKICPEKYRKIDNE